MIEIIPVGGYSEIGRNCTIVKWKKEAVMLDFGLMMENYVAIQEEYESLKGHKRISRSVLIREKAVPNIDAIKDELKYVKAICVSHAHLDHLGAIPYFTGLLRAPIYASKFTIEVLKELLRDKKASENKLIAKNVNSKFRISKNIKIQFINITHSTPQTVMIVVHTPEGAIVYANDFKLDETPVFGEKTNIESLKKLTNVKALIMDSLYSLKKGKASSESNAKKLLEKTLLNGDYSDRNIVVTTFASQIVRLNTLVEIAERMNRTPVFVGRSMGKYLDAAKKAGIVDFDKRAEFIRYGSAIEKYFKKTHDTKNKLFIVTGHQGEPKAVLSRMSKGSFFPFVDSDIVIFSCNTIPTEDCFKNRARLEKELKARNLKVIKDIHSSGHAHQEDHKELILLLNPENIIPTHGNPEMLKVQKELCLKLGYDANKIHILKNLSKIYV